MAHLLFSFLITLIYNITEVLCTYEDRQAIYILNGKLEVKCTFTNEPVIAHVHSHNRVRVNSATFNIISVISWQSVLLFRYQVLAIETIT